jgi:hypothetical protein
MRYREDEIGLIHTISPLARWVKFGSILAANRANYAVFAGHAGL